MSKEHKPEPGDVKGDGGGRSVMKNVMSCHSKLNLCSLLGPYVTRQNKPTCMNFVGLGWVGNFTLGPTCG